MLILSFMFMLAILLKPLTKVLMGQPTVTYPDQMTKSMKWAFIISLIPLFLFISMKKETVISNYHWMTTHSTELYMSFKLDLYAVIFFFYL